MIIREIYEDKERLNAVEFVFNVSIGYGDKEPLTLKLDMYLEMERPTRRHKYRNTGCWSAKRSSFYNISARSRIEEPPELTDKVILDVMNNLIQRVRLQVGG